MKCLLQIRLLFFAVSLMAISTLARSQTTTWYFGNNVGIDFSFATPVSTLGPISTDEGCAVVSDEDGEVIFSTDGTKIYDVSGNLAAGELKGSSSTTHSALIVPHPKNPCGRFFIFTVGSSDTNSFKDGLQVTEVLVQNQQLQVKPSQKLVNNVTEKLAATPDGKGGFWLVAHDYDTSASTQSERGRYFYAYHISDNTSLNNLLPKISKTGSRHWGRSPFSGNFWNTIGQMKFNSAGDRLALAIYESKKVELFHFNKNTGKVSALVSLNQFAQQYPGALIYGIEFSPNDQNLFVSTGYVDAGDSAYVWAFSLNALNAQSIWQSRKELYKTEATIQQKYPVGGLQLGPDKKVYVARRDELFVSRIDQPDQFNSLSFADTAQLLAQKCMLSLPTSIKMKSCDAFVDPCMAMRLDLNQDTSVCAHDSVLLGVWEEAEYSYRWSTGARTSTIYGQAGNTYKLRVTNDSLGCYSDDSVVVDYPPDLLALNLPADTSFCRGHGTGLSFYQPGIEVTWNKLVESNEFVVEKEGMIQMMLENGCDTLYHHVNAKINDCTCDFVVADAFTPNDDGVNDYFEIRIPCPLEHYSISIYNRWGELVFATADPADYWDGRMQGKKALPGVYIYILEYQARFDELRMKRDHVTLLR